MRTIHEQSAVAGAIDEDLSMMVRTSHDFVEHELTAAVSGYLAGLSLASITARTALPERLPHDGGPMNDYLSEPIAIFKLAAVIPGAPECGYCS